MPTRTISGNCCCGGATTVCNPVSFEFTTLRVQFDQIENTMVTPHTWITRTYLEPQTTGGTYSAKAVVRVKYENSPGVFTYEDVDVTLASYFNVDAEQQGRSYTATGSLYLCCKYADWSVTFRNPGSSRVSFVRPLNVATSSPLEWSFVADPDCKPGDYE